MKTDKQNYEFFIQQKKDLDLHIEEQQDLGEDLEYVMENLYIDANSHKEKFLYYTKRNNHTEAMNYYIQSLDNWYNLVFVNNAHLINAKPKITEDYKNTVYKNILNHKDIAKFCLFADVTHSSCLLNILDFTQEKSHQALQGVLKNMAFSNSTNWYHLFDLLLHKDENIQKNVQAVYGIGQKINPEDIIFKDEKRNNHFNYIQNNIVNNFNPNASFQFFEHGNSYFGTALDQFLIWSQYHFDQIEIDAINNVKTKHNSQFDKEIFSNDVLNETCKFLDFGLDITLPETKELAQKFATYAKETNKTTKRSIIEHQFEKMSSYLEKQSLSTSNIVNKKLRTL